MPATRYVPALGVTSSKRPSGSSNFLRERLSAWVWPSAEPWIVWRSCTSNDWTGAPVFASTTRPVIVGSGCSVSCTCMSPELARVLERAWWAG